LIIITTVLLQSVLTPLHSQQIKTIRAPFLVNSNTTGSQREENIEKLDQQGNFVLVWHDLSSDGIFFDRFDNFGNSIESIGEQYRWVNDDSVTSVMFPDVDALANGDFIVCFVATINGSSEDHIYGQYIKGEHNFSRIGANFRMDRGEYTPQGNRHMTALSIYSLTPSEQDPFYGYGLIGVHNWDMDDDDNVLLSGFSIPFPAGPPSFPSDFDSLGWVELLDQTGGSQYGLAGAQKIAVDNAGTFVVAYTIGSPYRVKYRTFDYDSWAASDTILINGSGLASDYTGPGVAINTSDERIFTYGRKDEQGHFNVYFVRYYANEDRIDASPVQVNDVTFSAPNWLYDYPPVATFPNDDFVVAWLSSNQSIYVRRFDSSGSAIDADEVLLVGPGDILNPRMDTFQDRIYLTWTDSGDGGDIMAGVWSIDTSEPTISEPNDHLDPDARIYDESGNRVTTVTTTVVDTGARINSGLESVSGWTPKVAQRGVVLLLTSAFRSSLEHLSDELHG
jgi:hypothetical protein